MKPLFFVKNFIKSKYPKIFGFIKNFLNSKNIKPIYEKFYSFIFPPNERYDPEAFDVENEYFDEYTTAVIGKVYGKVLDLGCGYGYFTKKIADKNNVASVIAVDKISPEEFRFLDHSKIKYLERDITSLKQEAQFSGFDVVVSTEFIEHIKEEDLIIILGWIKNCLREGGGFIGSTPNNKTELPKFSKVVYHIREYQPDYFKDLLKNAGFKNINLKIFDNFFVWQCEK